MPTSVNANVSLSITGTIGGGTGLIPPSASIALSSLIAQLFTNGTASAGKINQAMAITGTVAASGNTTVDLNAFGGALDAVGNAVNITKLKLLAVQLVGVVGTPVEADYITIGDASSDAFADWLGSTGTAKIYTGGMNIAYQPGVNGYALVATTACNLKIVAGANSGTVTFNIVALGATA